MIKYPFCGQGVEKVINITHRYCNSNSISIKSAKVRTLDDLKLLPKIKSKKNNSHTLTIIMKRYTYTKNRIQYIFLLMKNR